MVSVSPLEQLRIHGNYYNNIFTKSRAQDFLKDKKPGEFMFRPSQKKDVVNLSYVDSEHQVKHVKLTQSPIAPTELCLYLFPEVRFNLSSLLGYYSLEGRRITPVFTPPVLMSQIALCWF